ncbi:MAG TPA: DUF4131 domain-containing protein [Candidatus Acidoferrales bacterium]|nr:DUF4131 domain-containing protein [Candidatus Acidoferrales bacterium]
MKLPALGLVFAFASGIGVAKLSGTHLAMWLAIATIFILAGLFLALASKPIAAAGILALAAWFALSATALQMQQGDAPSDDAATLIGAGKIDTSEPLRWHGVLREDPEYVPWGLRYTMDLENVRVLGRATRLRGGLRLNYYFGRGHEDLPNLRAGDPVEALSRARLPKNYEDPGAFNERGFLLTGIGQKRSSYCERTRKVRSPRRPTGAPWRYVFSFTLLQIRNLALPGKNAA